MKQRKTEGNCSRQEKIVQVKNAFSETGTTSFRTAVRNDAENAKEKKCPFCLIRMMLAGILFFVLIAGFHYKVSFGTFNQKSIEKMLSDTSRWEQIVNHAQKLVKEAKNR